jgi:hypothetical protein
VPLLPTKNKPTVSFDLDQHKVQEIPLPLVDQKQDDNWQMANHKDIAKEWKSTFETNSYKYLPEYLLPLNNAVHTPHTTKMVLPISLKIMVKKHNDNNPTFKPARVVAAILNAMQQAYSDTYLGPLENGMEEAMIYCMDNIPIDKGLLKLYLATPVNPPDQIHLLEKCTFTPIIRLMNTAKTKLLLII